ncbi:hypothetical protein P7228_09585 [Altererythrobacter arenosus]|uniref:Uncharacterized protein n=1 Tax=Altererythrobacter arenosus TaxID=3032592 RepID=A0ABY8FQ64_9SPHN|nr:hypothetical protein [Altererythrobacter sp. CAU 1644]WFL76250.1 hypothetical protein P7228_09585 [Altererythrobacter sp. CAU 1644]
MNESGDVARGWRNFFWIAAIFNFLIGLAGMITPDASVDARIVGLLVFCFGVVYYFVARDPLRYAQVLWAGVIGKVGVVALLAPEAFGENGEPLVAAVLVGDALFALGFLAFLFTGADAGGE